MPFPPLLAAVTLAVAPLLAAEPSAAFGDLAKRLLVPHPELKSLVEKGQPELAGAVIVSPDQGQALLFAFPAAGARSFTFRPAGLDPARLYQVVPLLPAALEGLPEGGISGDDLMTAGITLSFAPGTAEIAVLLRPGIALL